MGYVVPPLKEHARRYREFLQAAQLPNDPIAEGLAQFDRPTDPVLDKTDWTLGAAGVIKSAMASPAKPPTPPASNTDPYSQLYLTGQALGRLISVQLNTSNQLVFEIDGIPKAFPVPSVSPSTPHTAASRANLPEIAAQNTAPEMFLLWTCKQYINETNYPTRLSALCALIDIAAIALPEVLYRSKRMVSMKRPFQVLSSVDELIPDRPGHSAWPGGHAFAMGAISTLIYEALQGKFGSAEEEAVFKDRLERAARRIANNREGAGLHWAADAKAGLEAGAFVVNQLINYSVNSKNKDPDIQYLVTVFNSIQ